MRKCCYQEVIGEKRSLKALIEMAEFSLKLLSMDTLEQAMMHYNSLEEPPKYHHYIENEVFHLIWNK